MRCTAGRARMRCTMDRAYLRLCPVPHQCLLFMTSDVTPETVSPLPTALATVACLVSALHALTLFSLMSA